MNDKIAVLIPALNPDEKLLKLVAALKQKFSTIVVVNDGSTTGRAIFEVLRHEGVSVLDHLINKGKGAALKTGIGWIRDRCPNVQGVVTADSDGQHREEDIARIAGAISGAGDSIVLGVRAFRGEVPFRSRLGNLATRRLFRLLTGLAIKDTQTGLRGIPRDMFDRMLRIGGDKYEYEMRVLADCKHHAKPPLQIDIDTVYLDGNASSHFSPIRDSIKIWVALIKYAVMGR